MAVSERAHRKFKPSSGGALPHLDKIQAAFGSHDVSNVQAYTGAAAAGANKAMGAEAYATGNKVAFGGSASLHTAAHEAAHVVQQRGGVSLKGGVGQVGDAYEQHADAVADRVVQGKSAEGLLDKMVVADSSAGQQSPVQKTDLAKAHQAGGRGVVQMNPKDNAKPDGNAGGESPPAGQQGEAKDGQDGNGLDPNGFQGHMKSRLEVLWGQFVKKVDTKLKAKAPKIKGYSVLVTQGVLKPEAARDKAMAEFTGALGEAVTGGGLDGIKDTLNLVTEGLKAAGMDENGAALTAISLGAAGGVLYLKSTFIDPLLKGEPVELPVPEIPFSFDGGSLKFTPKIKTNFVDKFAFELKGDLSVGAFKAQATGSVDETGAYSVGANASYTWKAGDQGTFSLSAGVTHSVMHGTGVTGKAEFRKGNFFVNAQGGGNFGGSPAAGPAPGGQGRGTVNIGINF